MDARSTISDENPIDEQAAQQATRQAFSPLDLPNAFSIPDEDAVSYEDLHPVLQELVDEHERIVDALDAFEQTLSAIMEQGFDGDSGGELARFFRYFDEHVVPHCAREEKLFFGPLREHLIESGAHSRMEPVTTSVDVLESDHVKLQQMAAVSFNFFGLAGRLPDAASRAVTLDAAVEQGRALVERLRLHILREENVVYPVIQKDLADELDRIAAGVSAARRL